MPVVEIWTDGSCLGNPGAGGWAAVLKFGETQKEVFGNSPEATNNQMELTAAVEALKTLKRPCRVRLYSDSEYLVKTMTHGWKRKKNTLLWWALDEAVACHNVEWIWIKGHAENENNNRADALAYFMALSAKKEAC